MNTKLNKNNMSTSKRPIKTALVSNEAQTHSSSDINIVRFVKDGEQSKAMGTNEKFFDTALTNTLAVAGAISDLFPPTQGVGVSQRVGDSVKIKRMRIHLDSIDVTDVSVITRVIIFQWHPSSALAVPTVTDVLQTAAYNSFHEFTTVQNYTVLADVVFTQNNTPAAGAATATTSLSAWIDLCPRKGFQPTVIFSPAATTGTNKIYMLRIASKAIFSSLVSNTRIIYTDS